MKRLITLLLILAGVAFAQAAHAQTDKDKKKKKKDNTEQKTDSTNRNMPAPGGGAGGSGSGSAGSDKSEDIAIDEGGQSQPIKTHQKNSTATPATDTAKTKAAPKSEQKTTQGGDDPGSGNIAIDEDGPLKVKTEAKKPSSDSTIIAPVDQVARPQRRK